MPEINIREIAETLMLDAARRVPDFEISDKLYREHGGTADDWPPAGYDEIRDLIAKATITLEFPEETT